MFASFLITFRESLEVALVAGIVLTFLTKTSNSALRKYVWLGIGIGLGISLILSVFLKVIVGGLEGRAEGIFEGTLMFITAGLVTLMILWVHRQKNIAKNLRDTTAKHIQKGFPLGITFLIVSSVMREGIETVLYLQSVSRFGGEYQLAGAFLGLISAAAVGVGLFRFSLMVNLQRVLKISGAILLLFAAGLISHGVHEFQEVGLLPLFSFDPLVNMSVILDHSSTFGSILRTLFGYTAKPSILELISYGLYIFLVFLLEGVTNYLLLVRSRTVSVYPAKESARRGTRTLMTG